MKKKAESFVSGGLEISRRLCCKSSCNEPNGVENELLVRERELFCVCELSLTDIIEPYKRPFYTALCLCVKLQQYTT